MRSTLKPKGLSDSFEQDHNRIFNAKMVLSLTSVDGFDRVESLNPDIIELRLDLIKGERDSLLQERRNLPCLPVITTLRSTREGGNFSGDSAEWLESVRPWFDCSDFIDIERKYAGYAPLVRESGAGIIASAHLNYMPSVQELSDIERDLRSYGDLPKIVVTPGCRDDLLDLLAYTNSSPKPICVSVMGEKFRFARVVLPLFGSVLVYCHMGQTAAAGQYHISEMKKILKMLK